MNDLPDSERTQLLADLPGFAEAIESLSGVTDADTAISRHSAIVAEWVKEVPGRDRVLEAFNKIYAEAEARPAKP